MYHLPRPKSVRDDDAGVLEAFLKHRGFTVQGVSVTQDEIIVWSAADPSADVAAYQPEPTPRERHLAELNALSINDDPRSLRQAVALLREIVRER